MIAFGCSINAPQLYRRAAERGINRVAEPDSVIIANAAAGSLFRSYNLIMNSVADRQDLEALVLVHQDAEIDDPDFCAKLRRVLEEPDVGVIGCVGATGVRSIAWCEGSVTWASFTQRYNEFGGGELAAFTWLDGHQPGSEHTGDVDTLDGFLLVITPWALENLRFDEGLGQIHGYDFDFCLQVREAGKRVLTADFKVVHHHALQPVSNPEVWIEAHKKLAEKWRGRMPDVVPDWGPDPDDWRQRALQAEAEAGAERLQRVSVSMQAEAREKQLQRELEEVRGSTSWRMTRPMRELNLQLKSRLLGRTR
jgi:glycosyl transferase family 2